MYGCVGSESANSNHALLTFTYILLRAWPIILPRTRVVVNVRWLNGCRGSYHRTLYQRCKQQRSAGLEEQLRRTHAQIDAERERLRGNSASVTRQPAPYDACGYNRPF